MGRFDEAKKAIDANIRQNGKQEITGQIMNAVLNEIVSAASDETKAVDTKLDGTAAELDGKITAASSSADSRITEEVAAISSRIDAEKSELTKKIADESADLSAKITSEVNTLDAKLNDNTEILNEQINSTAEELQTNLDNKAAELNGKIGTETAALGARVTEETARLDTKIGNLRGEVDLKSFADGYYAGMRVGTADNLTARGDATAETFTHRTAGGDNAIEEGNATIKAIKGNSVALNNRVDMATSIATFGDIVAQADGSIIYTVTTKGDTDQYSNKNRISFNGSYYLSDNKVLILCKTLAPYDSSQRAFVSGYSDDANCSFTSIRYDTIAGEWSLCAGIATIPKTGNYDFRVGFPTIDISAVGDKFQLKDAQAINLTQMFGSGNEPATPEEFAARLGYASVDDMPYIPYNEGTIVDMTATGMRTAGTDDDGLAWTQERSWKPVIDKYFGGHLRSAGNVRDEITANKAVKRIGVVEDLGKLNWSSNSETWPTNSLYSFGLAKVAKDLGAAIFSAGVKNYSLKNTSYGVALSVTIMNAVNSTTEAKMALKGVAMNYELSTPDEHDIDGQNLTIKVAPGGTEEIIAPEGGDVIASAPVVADIVYPIDSYNTIKNNKAHIGTVSSLATAAKSDLVAAINELTGRVAALENKATETIAETSTEKEN